MNINDLYLNIHNSSLDSAIRQTDVQTAEDVAAYQGQGYLVRLTEAEFREKFPGVDPQHIHYIPSFSLSCFYFNQETLAVCPFHLEALLMDVSAVTIEGTCKEIARREALVSQGDYFACVNTLTDRLRLEYFSLLVKKPDNRVQNLYQMFFDAYRESDYGFRGLDKDTLRAILDSKTDEDKQRTEEVTRVLPEVLTVYRGGNTESTGYREAYSWTLDINIANFFAARRGYDAGHIVRGEVNKADIIDAFLDERSEQEIIVDPQKVRIVQEMPIHGMDLLNEILPEVGQLYRTYRDKMDKLRFAQKSDVHGKEHTARVLLLTQIIAEMQDLPLVERKILATAAIYHDTQRTHDGEDAVHGELARAYYSNSVDDPNHLVEFLCQYHCRPDEDGYAEIRNNRKLSRNRTQATRLLQVFKDADALDRVRFCIRDLDLNQLRLAVSRELTLVARICLEQIEI